MPPAKDPSQLDRALASIDLTYESIDELLEADLQPFQSLDETVFIYFNREEVIHLNRKGRRLLEERIGSFEANSLLEPAPIFWLEPSLRRAADDLEVLMSASPKPHTEELVTLSWGKTWLKGAKYPVRNSKGRSIALLFAGHEMPASEQIEQISTHCRITRKQTGNN